MIPTDLFVLLGGIGLFLYGMQALTAELKVMASDQARAAIRRFAGRPITGLAAGAAVTALIQSSSATMVMTLGFVGAGILSFGQSLGIILGANVGTTFTGWMVMLLGLKVNLGLIAFPLLFAAGIVRIVTSGAPARAGGVVAGLCLIFIGIDFMKQGMGVFDGLLSPEHLPADTLWGRLQLLGLGILVTVVTQSSSAGVAATIVILSEGHVSFTQAAALVIGMTVGTTFTGVLASIGGNLAMRRTALAHLIFNLTQGLVALSLLDVIMRIVGAGLTLADAALALVLFHTGFTLAGAAVFLPFTPAFGRLVEWLVPEREQPIQHELDPRFLSDPAAALDIVLSSARRQAVNLLGAVGARLAPGPRANEAALDTDRFAREEEAVSVFLSQVTLPERDPPRQERYGELMALIDHLRRLGFRAAQGGRLTVALYEPLLRREALFLGAEMRAFARIAGEVAAGDTATEAARSAQFERLHARLRRAEARLERREERLRRRVLATRAAPPRLFAITDAMRWLRRVTAHAERVLHHLTAAERQARLEHLPQVPPDPASPRSAPAKPVAEPAGTS